MLSSARLLVTGGNGLLGRHFLEKLQGDLDIHAIVHTRPETPIPHVTYHLIDLASPWDADTLPKEIDAVIHLAQSSRFREFPEQALHIFRVNVDSTARLLHYACAAGARKFVYASSGGVYGTGPKPFREDSPLAPAGTLGYYVGSKLCGEVLVRSYEGLMDVIIARIFFMYGAGQRRSMLIPRLVDSVRVGRPVTLQGPEGIIVNPVHVSDAVRVLEAALAYSGSLMVNVAGPDAWSIRRISDLIGERVGRTPVFQHLDGEPQHLVADTRVMRGLIGDDLMPLTEGIVDVL